METIKTETLEKGVLPESVYLAKTETGKTFEVPIGEWEYNIPHTIHRLNELKTSENFLVVEEAITRLKDSVEIYAFGTSYEEYVNEYIPEEIPFPISAEEYLDIISKSIEKGEIKLDMYTIKRENLPHETYSDNQIAVARQTDIKDFLENKEGFTFKQEGNSWRCVEHDSLVIMPDSMGWYWNSRQVGGASAIDWCEKIYNQKFHEAMNTIVGNADTPAAALPANTTPIPVPKQERDFLLPQANADNKRVYSYLTKTRGIDPIIVNQLISDKKLYQDTRGNCVFVGFNPEDEPKYAGLRGTLSDKQFRGEVTGSDKHYSFQMDSNSSSAQNDSNTVTEKATS